MTIPAAVQEAGSRPRARLQGKVAVVTGAASGLGAAMVRRFSQEGAHVVAVDRKNSLNENAGALAHRCDISDPDAVAMLFAACRERYGCLDILCNNAGIGGSRAPIHEYPVELWDEVMGVNLRGTFLMLREAISLMLVSGGGSIVNTGSIGGLIAPPETGAYGVSKAAIHMLTKQAAADYGSRSIRVNAIAPGIIDTPLIADLDTSTRAAVAAPVPLRRLGTAEEVAELALFLASDEASYISGAIIPVDGGRTAV